MITILPKRLKKVELDKDYERDEVNKVKNSHKISHTGKYELEIAFNKIKLKWH